MNIHLGKKTSVVVSKTITNLLRFKSFTGSLNMEHVIDNKHKRGWDFKKIWMLLAQPECSLPPVALQSCQLNIF